MAPNIEVAATACSRDRSGARHHSAPARMRPAGVSPRAWHLLRVAAVAGVVAVALSSCATVIAGTPRIAADTTNPDNADIGALRPGNYPTQPRQPRPRAGSQAAGAIFEAQRMAAATVGPWEVDPDITRVLSVNTTPVPTAASLWIDFPKPVPDIAEKHGYLTGFSSGRAAGMEEPTKTLILAVLRFPDEPSAAAAATEMAAEQMKVLLPDNVAVPTPIPGHPEAIGTTRPGTAKDKPTTVAEAFTAHGPYVLYQWTELENGGIDAATSMITRALDLSVPRIDAFRPTETWGFANLPSDPVNLLLRTLPLGPDDKAYPPMGSYPPAAALHYETDPLASSRLFDTAGVDGMSMINTVVYRARDPEAARLIADLATQQFKSGSNDDHPAAEVPGLPKSQCFDRRTDSIAMKAKQSQFYCVATAGKYAFKTSSQQLDDAHQQAAAQYLMLVSP